MVWLMIFIFLQFFPSHPQPLLFFCQVALLLSELQLLGGVLPRGSKDWPCYVPEHATPVLLVSFHLGILGCYCCSFKQ